MNRILEKHQLSANVFRMRLDAPLIARSRRAGQFVILLVREGRGERIPLTIADADAQAGWIDVVFQTVGVTTMALSRLSPGDSIPGVVGPLGRPTQISSYAAGGAPGWVVVVGGGIGVAPAHPIAQAFKAAGNIVTAVLGARERALVIMEQEMRAAADHVLVVTDDGSAGRKGLVTEPLRELCDPSVAEVDGVRKPKPSPDEVIVIGPPVMMKFAALATRPFGVKTIASLNSIMIDGTGMCGGCRVSVGGETKFVCVDGPEFDAHQVDFDNFIRRLGTFRAEETDHKCRSGLFS